MKLAAFDLEIAKQIPDNCKDFLAHGPLGISCAAVALSDTDEVKFWHDPAHLAQPAAQDIVRYLRDLIQAGYTLVTWNGCHFDFAVLADASGLRSDCALLALEHVDLMLLVTFQKGYFLSLGKALRGAGLAGKLKTVTLSDGTIMKDMEGAMAPVLWSRGEYDAVLDYLKQDAEMTLRLAQSVLVAKRIQWTSDSGKPQSVEIKRLLAVKECFALPEPDVSWMRSPPARKDFVAWMPEGVA